jgi:tetratricopeptide (TPR) repeat protein
MRAVRRFIVRRFVTLALILAGSLPLLASKRSDAASGTGSLDLAFRFASAIASDPKDRAKAQEAVIEDYLYLGATQRAKAGAAQIQGWRQAVVYTELARREVEKGNSAAAKALIGKAQVIRSGVAGWEGPRIDAHIASVLAALGDPTAKQMAEELATADAQQYAGRSAATLAVAQARAGDFTQAMETLGALEGNGDAELAAGRAGGYRTIAAVSGLTASQRREALDAARGASATLPPWDRVFLLVQLSDEYTQDGLRAAGLEAVRDAEAVARSLPGNSTGQIPLLAEVARGWGRIGEKERGRALLQSAIPSALDTLDIDRPTAYAKLSSAYTALGNTARARKLMEQAIAAAEALVNARPRALSAVDICRALGRDRIDPDSLTRGRLESLLSNLKDPW